MKVSFVKSNIFFLFTATPTPLPQFDPCDSCGANTQCINGACSCLADYQGDPYVGCRPECVTSNECPFNQACIGHKCKDPCPGTCGINAVCSVYNHIPICTCPQEMSGNPFTECRPYIGNYFITTQVFIAYF